MMKVQIFFNSLTKLWPIERACPDSSFLGGKWKSSGGKLRMNGGQNGSEKNGKGPNGNDFYLFQISIGLICHKLIKSFEC